MTWEAIREGTGTTRDEPLRFRRAGRNDPGNHEANYCTLLKILQQGCVSHWPHTTDWGTIQLRINWEGDLLKGDLIVPTVTCFCDIPPEHLHLYMEKYGHFGLSFDRKFLVQYGARPVTYVPYFGDDWRGIYGRELLKLLKQASRSFWEHVHEEEGSGTTERGYHSVPKTPKEARSLMAEVVIRDFLAFLKPFNSDLSQDHRDNFYMEREWRKFQNLKFEPADVKTIVVEDGFVDRLKGEMPTFADRVCCSSDVGRRLSTGANPSRADVCTRAPECYPKHNPLRRDRSSALLASLKALEVGESGP